MENEKNENKQKEAGEDLLKTMFYFQVFVGLPIGGQWFVSTWTGLTKP